MWSYSGCLQAQHMDSELGLKLNRRSRRRSCHKSQRIYSQSGPIILPFEYHKDHPTHEISLLTFQRQTVGDRQCHGGEVLGSWTLDWDPVVEQVGDSDFFLVSQYQVLVLTVLFYCARLSSLLCPTFYYCYSSYGSTHNHVTSWWTASNIHSDLLGFLFELLSDKVDTKIISRAVVLQSCVLLTAFATQQSICRH